MTVLDAPDAGDRREARGGIGIAQLSRGPWWAHVACLAAILAAVAAIIDPNGLFSGDEGAALAQAQVLREGGGWTVPHPLVIVDPTGEHFFVPLSDGGPRSFAPYAKHPLYPLLLTPLVVWFGAAGAVGLSMVATIVAALAAAKLAEEIDDDLRWPAFWATGLLSPLFFDAQLVIAHSLGAALAGWASWCLVRFVAGRSMGMLAGGIGLAVLTELVRTEASLFFVALGAVLLVLGLRRHEPRRWVTGCAVGGVAAVTQVSERLFVGQLLGSGAVPPPSGVGNPGFLESRVEAAFWTLFGFQGRYASPVVMVAVVVFALLVLAGFGLRFSRFGASAVSVLAVVAAAVALVGTVVPPDAISGLFAAFPLGALALVLITGADVRDEPARTLAGAFAVFTALVLATQYSVGGAAEWGGRFLAIGLPVLVPVLVAPLARIHRTGPPVARRVIAAGVVASLAFTVIGVRANELFHDRSLDSVASFEAGLAAAGPASGPDLGDGDRRPIVVTNAEIGRFGWSRVADVRGLNLPPGRVAGVLDRLAELGADTVVLVLDNAGVRDRDLTSGTSWRIERRFEPESDGFGTYVLRRR